MKQTILFCIAGLLASCSGKTVTEHITGYDVVAINYDGVSYSDSLILRAGGNATVLVMTTGIQGSGSLAADTETIVGTSGNSAVIVGCSLTKSPAGHTFNLTFCPP